MDGWIGRMDGWMLGLMGMGGQVMVSKYMCLCMYVYVCMDRIDRMDGWMDG